MDFLRLDPGSDWANRNQVRVLWSEGKLAEAREAVQRLPQDRPADKFLSLCLAYPSTLPAQLNQAVREIEPLATGSPDPENRYVFATLMSACGQNDAALRVLKSAIDGNYCAYQALQKDPLLAPLRSSPGYTQLLSAAQQCRENFLKEKAQLSH